MNPRFMQYLGSRFRGVGPSGLSGHLSHQRFFLAEALFAAMAPKRTVKRNTTNPDPPTSIAKKCVKQTVAADDKCFLCDCQLAEVYAYVSNTPAPQGWRSLVKADQIFQNTDIWFVVQNQVCLSFGVAEQIANMRQMKSTFHRVGRVQISRKVSPSAFFARLRT